MSFFSKLLGGGDVVKSIGDTLDNLVTSDEERLEKQLEITKAKREFDYLESKLLADQNIAQTEINKEEARSGNTFVAGWRPAIGWIGATALFYQFILLSNDRFTAIWRFIHIKCIQRTQKKC